MAKNRYLNLNMGLVKENFTIVQCKDIPLWKSRGFEKVRRYPIFRYIPKLSEVVMLSKPLNISQFGLDSIKSSVVVDIDLSIGTYGMGGAGFVGFKLQSYFGVRWLVYCIWSAGESILLDDKIIECHSKYQNRYNPYVSMDSWQNDVSSLKRLINGWKVQDIYLDDTTLEIILIDDKSNKHTIYTSQFCDKFPEQAGTDKKRKSFEDGTMQDYWLVIYDNTYLSV